MGAMTAVPRHALLFAGLSLIRTAAFVPGGAGPFVHLPVRPSASNAPVDHGSNPSNEAGVLVHPPRRWASALRMASPVLATPTRRGKRAQKTSPTMGMDAEVEKWRTKRREVKHVPSGVHGGPALRRREVAHMSINVTLVLDTWEADTERALRKSIADNDRAARRVMEGTRDALFLIRERLIANISEDAVFALTASNKTVESIALVTTRHATRGTGYMEQVYIGEAVVCPGADEKKNALSDLMFRIRNWADVPPGRFMHVPPGLLQAEYFKVLGVDPKDPMPDPLYGLDFQMVELTG